MTCASLKAHIINARGGATYAKSPIFWFPPMSNAGTEELYTTAHAHLPHCARTRFKALTSKSSDAMSLNVLLQKLVKQSSRIGSGGRGQGWTDGRRSITWFDVVVWRCPSRCNRSPKG
jgi:hypothetical protein